MTRFFANSQSQFVSSATVSFRIASALLKTTSEGMTNSFNLFLVLALPTLASAWFWDKPNIDANDPLEQTGPFNVIKTLTDIAVSDADLMAEIFQPDITTSGDLKGFVLFTPGFGASFKMYDDYLSHLASHGYLTVGMDFESAGFTNESFQDVKAQQVLEAIAVVQELDSSYASLPVIVAGHSNGGKISFYAASIDTSNIIDGVIAMDPVNSGAGPCFLGDACFKYPVAPNVQSGQRGILHQMNDNTPSSLIFRSQPDLMTNPDEQFNAQYFFEGSDGSGLDGAPSPSLHCDMGGFSHAGYVPMMCSEQVQLTKRTMVAWLQENFEGTNRSEHLTGAVIQADIQSGYFDSVAFR